jgi:hypothetical protein
MNWARVAALVVLSWSFAFAVQSTAQVHLKIQVSDQSGAVVPGAQVKVYASPNGSILIASITDAGGEASLGLSPGTYTLGVAAPGFQQYRQGNIQVMDGLSRTVKIVLTVASSGCGICVTPEWPLIQVESDFAERSIPLEHLDTLPLKPQRLHRRHFFS